MPMVKRKKHKPPSRIRYEKSHPVISFRISQDLHDRFKEVLKQRNQTAAGFFKDVLDKQQDAFLLGKIVTIPCRICGKPMDLNVNTPSVKAALNEAFSMWGHISCEKKRDEQLSHTY